ncbi:hypothetical protein D4Q52_03070 [Rhodopseudomonas palustris]|uniref:Uncharacterized protein n=1 Tax=Rhodopseudomonas palustris TaxID=1076 RepID=A0A418VNZ1_RHOPL|nr:hypothetical protein D4Q52_03070 [Rhodopseudomonas palustris]
MPGLVPGIHALLSRGEGVDGRDKPGYDVRDRLWPNTERGSRHPFAKTLEAATLAWYRCSLATDHRHDHRRRPRPQPSNFGRPGGSAPHPRAGLV